MLKQMLSDDRNEAVRETVTKSLALVVAFIENVDKYEQVRTKKLSFNFQRKKQKQTIQQKKSYKTTELTNKQVEAK